MMIEHLIIGLHATSITLKMVVAFAACRLIWFNLGLYRHPWQQDYSTLMRMALWVSIPLIVVGALISRILNLYYYVESQFLHDGFSTILIIVYLGLTITGLLAALVWINFTAYGRRKGCWSWLYVILAAFSIGVVVACASVAT